MAYDAKKANPTLIIPEAPAKITRKKKKPKEIAVVIPDNCTGCEACVPFCPVDCIEHVPRDTSNGINVVIPNVQIRFDECIGCKICVNVCEAHGMGCDRDVAGGTGRAVFRDQAPR